MSATTANLQKMSQSATELENISVAMTSNHSKLVEQMEQLGTKWHGEASRQYLDAFHQNSPNLEKMAVAIDEAATNLRTIGTTYNKAESSAADVIRSTLGKG